MNTQQPDLPYDTAAMNPLTSSRDRGATTRPKRLLTLAAAAVIGLSATACSALAGPTTPDGGGYNPGPVNPVPNPPTGGTDGQDGTTDQPTRLTPAPRELVGTWHNDTTGVDWFLTIAANGTYALSSSEIQVYDKGYVNTSGGKLQLN